VQELLASTGGVEDDNDAGVERWPALATARGARTTAPPSAATALTPTVPMMNLRRVNPALPYDRLCSIHSWRERREVG